MIKILILLSPFAFLSLIMENTSHFFKSWYRNFFSLLFVQIIVSIVLVWLFSMDYSKKDLLNKFIYLGGIYALIRSNSIVRELFGGMSTIVQTGVSRLKVGSGRWEVRCERREVGGWEKRWDEIERRRIWNSFFHKIIN